MEREFNEFVNKIEKEMACTAFAEAGEPCPIDTGDRKEVHSLTGGHTTEVRGIAKETVEDSMACTAFAEAGVPCPIGEAK